MHVRYPIERPSRLVRVAIYCLTASFNASSADSSTRRGAVHKAI